MYKDYVVSGRKMTTIPEEIVNTLKHLGGKAVIIINGVSGVGKDALVDATKIYLQGTEIYNISSVDPIKHWLKNMSQGEITRSEKDRQLVSDIKVALDKHSPILLHYIMSRIRNADQGIFFVHLRDRESIKHLNADLEHARIPYANMLVRRQAVEEANTFANDGDLEALHCINEWDLFPERFRFNNNGTFEDMNFQIQTGFYLQFLQEMLFTFVTKTYEPWPNQKEKETDATSS